MTAAADAGNGRRPHITAPSWRRELVYAGAAILLGFADALLLIGPHAINPLNTSWLKSDPGVFQAGWDFLRREPWRFPPDWLSRLDYPFGISAAYLDVIPIIAVPMKLFAGLLPRDFQFFGVYLSLCLILQGYFALKLLANFALALPELLIGALFFLNAPILLSRIYVHFSLSAQWLIVAALFCYFRPVQPAVSTRYLAPFLPLAFVAGGFSPYIAVMVLFIALGALLRTGQLAPALLWGAGLLVCTGVSFLFFGFLSFATPRALPGDGYTMFSLDLLSPLSRSAYLPGPGYEGYNYLGAGILLLLAVCIVVRPGLVRLVWIRWRPLIMISLALTLLALSVRITFDRHTLFTVPVPAFAFHALAIFRSSGRFFWPVHYLLVTAAIVGIACTIRGKRPRLAVLASALVIQAVDLAPIREAVAAQFRTTVANPLNAADWAKLGASYRHLVVVPAWQCGLMATPLGDAGWQWFAQVAATSGMTLNSVHSARPSTESNSFNCRLLPAQIARGVLDRQTAYVLDDRLARLAGARNSRAVCRRVNHLNLCTIRAK